MPSLSGREWPKLGKGFEALSDQQQLVEFNRCERHHFFF